MGFVVHAFAAAAAVAGNYIAAAETAAEGMAAAAADTAAGTAAGAAAGRSLGSLSEVGLDWADPSFHLLVLDSG